MQPGTIVSGVVLDLDNDWVTVHVGLKSEGIISLDEFRTVQVMSRHHGHDHGHIEPPEVINIDDGVFAYIQPDGSLPAGCHCF